MIGLPDHPSPARQPASWSLLQEQPQNDVRAMESGIVKVIACFGTSSRELKCPSPTCWRRLSSKIERFDPMWSLKRHLGVFKGDVSVFSPPHCDKICVDICESKTHFLQVALTSEGSPNRMKMTGFVNWRKLFFRNKGKLAGEGSIPM